MTQIKLLKPYFLSTIDSVLDAPDDIANSLVKREIAEYVITKEAIVKAKTKRRPRKVKHEL